MKKRETPVTDIAIEIKDLTVAFGEKKALDNVNVVFEPGKIYCILGPNGCGKSTLIKAVVREYAATGALAYVAQESYGTIGLPLVDYVSLGRYDSSKFLSGIGERDRKLVNEAIAGMDLAGREYQLYDTLSGGEKQRAMIARALAQDTPWLIMDEPTASLDAKHVRIISDVMKSRIAKGCSVIVVLHDLNAAAGVADRFILMKDGHVVGNVERLDCDMLSDIYDTPFVTARTDDGREVFVAG